MRGLSRRGFGTVEAMVALTLLAVVAASLADGLAHATAARLRGSQQMQATQHALTVIEQLRSGDPVVEEPASGLDCDWSTTAVPGMPGLSRFSVTVGTEGRELARLEGLSWRSP